MPRTRQELEQIERQTLAPYAQFSGGTRGRAYKEIPPVWRTHYQRDRDRVIHSRAFRRLEYKTQVFLNGTGDHLRTRLTHTIEVAAIARNIASALKLNSDLAETIALAHDLGHSPFGHKGEISEFSRPESFLGSPRRAGQASYRHRSSRPVRRFRREKFFARSADRQLV
jgi:dGTPase